MGIKLETTLSSGVIAIYHRVDTLLWERKGSHFAVRGSIGAYLDKASADAGRTPVGVKPYEASLPVDGGEPTREMIYKMLTAPITEHEYQEEGFGEREDGSTGQIVISRTAQDANSITGFNDAEMA
jgi:hypothetical protein